MAFVKLDNVEVVWSTLQDQDYWPDETEEILAYFEKLED